MNTKIIGFETALVNDRGSDIGQLSEVSGWSKGTNIAQAQERALALDNKGCKNICLYNCCAAPEQQDWCYFAVILVKRNALCPASNNMLIRKKHKEK